MGDISASNNFNVNFIFSLKWFLISFRKCNFLQLLPNEIEVSNMMYCQSPRVGYLQSRYLMQFWFCYLLQQLTDTNLYFWVKTCNARVHSVCCPRPRNEDHVQQMSLQSHLLHIFASNQSC